jgi:hypothetical protein
MVPGNGVRAALINSVFLCAELLAYGLPGNQDALLQA